MTALHSHRDFLQCVQERKRARQERKDATRSTLRRWDNYVEAEETVRNDYSENYECGSGGWPSRWILGAGDDELCEEYAQVTPWAVLIPDSPRCADLWT